MNGQDALPGGAPPSAKALAMDNVYK